MPRYIVNFLRHLPLMAFLTMSSALAAQQVSDTEGLERALNRADGGEIIRLSPGSYEELVLVDGRRGTNASYSSEVTITSADPSNPARLSSVDVRGASNLRFDQVVFDYSFEPSHPRYLRPFSFQSVSSLVISRSVFDGALAEGISEVEDGHGWAIGVSIRDSKNIVLQENHFSGFHRGLTMGSNNATRVIGNEFERIRMDGMNFVAMNGIKIEDNYLHDFERALGSNDHSDMIQFWTNGSGRPSSDVVVRGNVLMSGAGDATQSIFMRNEEVDLKRAGEEMFYNNVIIEQNVIVNGHLHGVTLGESQGVIIRNNTLLRNQASAKGEMENEEVKIPRINLAEQSRYVEITDNIAGGIPSAAKDWTVAGNLVVQDRSLLKPLYYSRLFASPISGDQGELDSFLYKPFLQSMYPGRKTGSALLIPEANRSEFQN